MEEAKESEKPSEGTVPCSTGCCCVYGFGYNGFSQLDLNSNKDKHQGMTVSSPIRVPTLDSDITRVVGSWTTTVSLRESGKVCVMGWIPGTDLSGLKEDLLHGKPVTDVACSWNGLMLLTQAGECFVWKNFTTAGSTVAQIVPSDQRTKFSSVSCGDSHYILVTDQGQVGFCANELDDREARSKSHVFTFKPFSFEHQISSVDCGKEHVLMLATSGSLYSFGNGSRGQLGHGLTNEEEHPRLVEALDGVKVVSVSAGGWHSAAITEFDDLYMWGWNQSGQLGLPSDTTESDSTTSSGQVQRQMVPLPCPVDFTDNLEVVTVSCGSRHSAAITGDGCLWTWGWGFYGQLGHGNTMNRCTPTQVGFFSRAKSKLMCVSCGDWNTFVIVE